MAMTSEQRRKARMKRYGLTVEQYEDMAKLWNHTCWICEQPDPHGRRLAVDHDASTGLVRGLLCTDCNRGIGLMGHDPERLERAARYLRDANTPQWWDEPA
jgi:hypothetical protein